MIADPTKYFGCELGAQTQFDLKNERYIVNGEHDAGKLQDILDGFIKKFVLCANCENPETTLTVRKAVIHTKCKACGNAGTIDPKHKLSTFILKNPPKVEKEEIGQCILTLVQDSAGYGGLDRNGLRCREEGSDEWRRDRRRRGWRQ